MESGKKADIDPILGESIMPIRQSDGPTHFSRHKTPFHTRVDVWMDEQTVYYANRHAFVLQTWLHTLTPVRRHRDLSPTRVGLQLRRQFDSDGCVRGRHANLNETPTSACRHEDLSHTRVKRRPYIAPHGPHALFRHGVLSHATLDSNLNIANWAIKMTDLHIPNSSIANLEILERIGGITEHWQVQTNHLCPWVRVHAK